MVKIPPAMWETWVQPLGGDDPLEEGMATHSVFWPGESHGQRSLVGYSPWGHTSVLAWRIPWKEKPGRLQSMGLHRVGHH